MQTPRTSLILDAAAVDLWCTTWETTGKLPGTRIPCQQCRLGITATHGNLASKIQSHGGIRELLTGFVCKSCKMIATPRKVAVVRPRRARKPRKTNTESTVAPDANGRYNIPVINLNPIRTVFSISDLAKNAELCKEFTQDTCLQPALFLDADSTCDHCVLFEHCQARCKTLSRARVKQLARSK